MQHCLLGAGEGAKCRDQGVYSLEVELCPLASNIWDISKVLIKETELCLTSLWTLCWIQRLPWRAFQHLACIWEVREVEHEVHTPVSFHREHQMSQSLQTKMYQSPIILLLTYIRNPCSPCSNLCQLRNHQNNQCHPNKFNNMEKKRNNQNTHLQSTLLSKRSCRRQSQHPNYQNCKNLSAALVFLTALLYV